MQSLGTSSITLHTSHRIHTGPLAVKAVVWVIVERLHAAGCSRLYDWPSSTTPAHLGTVHWRPGNTSIPATALRTPANPTQQLLWCLVCVALLDALHDTWFYWTHRLLHCKPLYKHVHYMHHRHAYCAG